MSTDNTKKFEEVTDECLELFNDVVENDPDFFSLGSAKFKLLFFNKKKKKSGQLVAAYIQKTNDLLRYMTSQEANDENGFDYIVYFDQNIWNEIADEDRKRIIQHELLHCVYKPSSKKNQYSLRDHTIQGFHEEVERETLEGGDQRWQERIFEVAESVYDKDDEDGE